MIKLYRIKKLENEIKKNISLIILNKFNNEKLKYVNLLKVKLSNNYSLAKIFVIFINKNDIENNIKILNKSSSFIRKKLFKILNFKYIPKLIFFYDFDTDKSIKIINLINNLKNL